MDKGQKIKDGAIKFSGKIKLLISGVGKQSISIGLGSISAKLILAFAIPIILILILGISSYQKASETIITNAEKATTNTIYAKGTYLALGFEGVSQSSLELITMKEMDLYYNLKNLDENLLSIDQSKAKTSIFNRMWNMQSINKFIYNIYMFSSVGSGLSTTSLKSIKPVYYSQFLETEVGKEINSSTEKTGWLNNNQFFENIMAEESQVNTKSDISDYAITMWRKTANATNTYVIIDIKQEVIDEAVAELNFGEKSLTAFIAPGGRETVYQGSDEKTAQKVKTDEKITVSDLPYYQKALESKDQYGYFYDEFQGEKYLFSYSKIGNTGAILCSLIPKSVITAQADAIRGLTVIISAIAILLAILTCMAISLSLKRAVKNSIRSLEKAKKGDLTVSFDTMRQDEFGTIARSTASMVGGIRVLIKQMQSVGTKVNVSAGDVSINMEKLLEATKEISFAVDDIEGGVTSQAKDAEQCLIQMSNLSDRINSVFDSTHEIEKIADKTKSITEEGIVIMEQLNKTSQAATDITKDIIQNIENFEVQSQSIGSIISVMNNIASQTNLLSLNASIEAARAGEAGRGFEVVAREIRKLADQSMESSKKIEKIIGIIQDKSHNTVMSAKQAEHIIDTQNIALKQSVAAFHNISNHVESLVHNLNLISEGMKEIEDSKTETLDAIQNISAISEESASASEEVGATVSNMVKAVAQLNEIASELSENARNMEDSISVFQF